MKLLQENLKIDSITVMVQKEVAERLTAIPGEKDAGSITYSIYYYTEPKIVLNVPRNCFLPVPDVNSSVISLKLLKNPRISVPNEEVFFHIIKSAFSQKRKTLVNSLVNNKIIDTKESAEKLLNSIGLDTKIRAEKLTIENFAELSKKIALNK